MTVNSNLSHALSSIRSEDGPVYAVLDGAHFDNLPQQLLIGGFVSRPLYLDRGDNDPQRVLTSPHLVWIDERELAPLGRKPQQVIPELLALIGTSAGAVFWQCPAGGEVLYSHLRGINMALIPNEAASSGKASSDEESAEGEEISDSVEAELVEPDVEGSDESDDDTHTMVLFRHADANVIAQLLPCLAPDEAARFMGPASFVFGVPDPEWCVDGPVSFLRATGDARYRGPLRLSKATLTGIEDAQLKASRGTIAEYLRKTAPEYTDRLSRHELHKIIVDAEASGNELGFESEYAHGLWALLALITGGETLSNRHVVGHFLSDPRDPEEVLDELYDQMSDASDYDLEELT